MNLGGSNFTNFQNVRVGGNNQQPGQIRIATTSAFESTISVAPAYHDASYAYTLPAKSGKITLGGTFALDLPVIAAAGFATTAVTIAGLRVEDGITVSPQSVTAFAAQSARGVIFVSNAVPTANTLTLTLVNPFATATLALTQSVWAYTVVR